MQLQWSHAFVHVQDMDTMLDFYINVLGFEITDRGELNGNELVFLSQAEQAFCGADGFAPIEEFYSARSHLRKREEQTS